MTILGRLRVLFFGSGSPASVRALQSLILSTSIAGVVVPRHRRLWQRNPAAPLLEMARKNGLPIYALNPRRQRALANDLKDSRPDLICIATFPFILHSEVLEIAEGINLHTSLLPRHRGPDPLFWTYLCDDRTTGVTVHWLNGLADAGPILLQREIPLARGRQIIDLYFELATIGAALVAEAVQLISDGHAVRVPQDEAQATVEPSRAAGNWHIDTERWPAERVWHVIRGLTTGKGSLLDHRSHGTARIYSVEEHDRQPGTIEPIADGMRIFCVDGYVDVNRA